MSLMHKYLTNLASEQIEGEDEEYNEGEVEEEEDRASGRTPAIRQARADHTVLISHWKKGSRLSKWIQRFMKCFGAMDGSPFRIGDGLLGALAEIVNLFGREMLLRAVQHTERDPLKKKTKKVKDTPTQVQVTEMHLKAALEDLGLLQFVQDGDELLRLMNPKDEVLPPLAVTCRPQPRHDIKLNAAFCLSEGPPSRKRPRDQKHSKAKKGGGKKK